MPRKTSTDSHEHLESFISCAGEYRRLERHESDARATHESRAARLTPLALRWNEACAEDRAGMKAEYVAACELHESEKHLNNLRQAKLVAFDAAIGHLARWCATSMTESSAASLPDSFENAYARAMLLRVEHLDGKQVEFQPSHYFSQVLAKMLNYRSPQAFQSDLRDCREGRPADPTRKKRTTPA